MKIKIAIENTGEELYGKSGETLYSALTGAGLFIDAPCGGAGLCGKCKVKLILGAVDGESADSSGYIRTCRAKLKQDIVIGGLSGREKIENETVISARTVKKDVVNAGVALDIGTTTVCAQAVDLDSGEILCTVAELNKQKAYGADVISRICAAGEGKTEDMFRAVRETVNNIIADLKKLTGIKAVSRLCVAGNTTMLHLFTNTDPSPMGRIPFAPVFTAAKSLAGESLGYDAKEVFLLPSFSAFVGADVAAGLAAVDIFRSKKAALFIDMGTNGEIALFSGSKLYLCSTAAGPALEGAGISCGIGGVSGAVNSVMEENGAVKFTTVSNGAPRGICGCGLIDAVALLLRKGAVDETGAFDEDNAFYKEKFINGEFFICDNVTLTNKDIRQYQLVKSAIGTGIDILIKKASVKYADIETFYIAGGLGFFINKENACRTGLLPKELINKMQICGNLSLSGAVKYLSDSGFPAYCDKLKTVAQSVDLASDPDFTDGFMQNMMFDTD